MSGETLFSYKVSDDIFDNTPFPKSEIIKYDVDACYDEVKNKIHKYRLSVCEYNDIPKPKITKDYNVKYECFINHKTDNVGKYIEKKVDKEIEIKLLYSDFVKGLSCLNRNEFTYFMDYFLYDLSENRIIEKLDTTRFLFNTIKDSCIIKMAKAFNIAKYRESN